MEWRIERRLDLAGATRGDRYDRLYDAKRLVSTQAAWRRRSWTAPGRMWPGDTAGARAPPTDSSLRSDRM